MTLLFTSRTGRDTNCCCSRNTCAGTGISKCGVKQRNLSVGHRTPDAVADLHRSASRSTECKLIRVDGPQDAAVLVWSRQGRNVGAQFSNVCKYADLYPGRGTWDFDSVVEEFNLLAVNGRRDFNAGTEACAEDSLELYTGAFDDDGEEFELATITKDSESAMEGSM